jgi:alpha-L-fucosidase
MKRILLLALLIILLQKASFSQANSYTPSQENLKARQWFADSKFGLFIHWGSLSIRVEGRTS